MATRRKTFRRATVRGTYETGVSVSAMNREVWVQVFRAPTSLSSYLLPAQARRLARALLSAAEAAGGKP